MQNFIKVGIGVIVLNDGKILLGHRTASRGDTGGIYEVDCWCLPGGKQEYGETTGLL
ncbi:NUDIX domain-containing protein [Candidatus Saccharibacteria bacterium]|nr:NUDIX domain-containing protein [Candidatus Saccharibacteria bacterium]